MALLERPAASPEYVLYWVVNNVNDKVYVGQTCKGLKRRWHQHKAAAKRGSDNRFHAALRKYGPDSFELREVGTASSREQADQLEKLWIILFQSYLREHGYNSTFGGDGVNATEEVKLKMREKASHGAKSWLYRRDLSDADLMAAYSEKKTLKKIAAEFDCSQSTVKNRIVKLGIPKRKKVVPFSPNRLVQTQKLVSFNLGRVRPESEKQAISQTMRGRVFSEEHLKNLQLAAVKRKAEGRYAGASTNESKAKASAATRADWLNPEIRQKRLDGLKKHFEAKK